LNDILTASAAAVRRQTEPNATKLRVTTGANLLIL
jgi:hypothetical protein